MVLWQVTSYRQAVDTELALRRAVAHLRTRHGRRWRHHTPGDLVWMLRTGTHVDEACRRVATLMKADSRREGTQTEAMANGPGDGCDEGRLVGRRLPRRFDVVATDVSPVQRVLPEDGGRFAVAVRLNREHWAETGRPISAETLRKRLRLGAAKSREWCRQIRDEDRAVVCALPGPTS
jgi:hypothetical protein